MRKKINLVTFEGKKEAEVYIAVCGENGYGVYQDLKKLQKAMEYLANAETKEFNSMEKARVYARGQYVKEHYLSACSTKEAFKCDYTYYPKDLNTKVRQTGWRKRW